MFSLLKNIDKLSSLNPIGTPFMELLTVESTNNYAMGLVRAGMAQSGMVVFTHDQTRGKGQRNKQWASQKDMNIAMSVVVEPSFLSSADVFLLSMMTAVAVREFFDKYAADEVKIKWPNDIYWRDRKAAGILIENLWQGSEWRSSVIGIGVNINQTDFSDLTTRAVSLKQVTGKKYEPVLLAKELCVVLNEKYQRLLENASSIVSEYKSHLFKIHETVKLKKANRVFEATIKDVNSAGQLVVQHTTEEIFDVGEIEWVINGA